MKLGTSIFLFISYLDHQTNASKHLFKVGSQSDLQKWLYWKIRKSWVTIVWSQCKPGYKVSFHLKCHEWTASCVVCYTLFMNWKYRVTFEYQLYHFFSECSLYFIPNFVFMARERVSNKFIIIFFHFLKFVFNRNSSFFLIRY